MSAGTTNIIIEQGATFEKEILIKDPSDVPINLTGYTARSYLRANPTDSAIIAEFVVTVKSPATDGKLSWVMSAANTSLVPADETKGFNATIYYYDLEIESSGGVVSRIIQGQARLIPSVTR